MAAIPRTRPTLARRTRPVQNAETKRLRKFVGSLRDLKARLDEKLLKRKELNDEIADLRAQLDTRIEGGHT